jgi:hypothetical protein
LSPLLSISSRWDCEQQEKLKNQEKQEKKEQEGLLHRQALVSMQ